MKGKAIAQKNLPRPRLQSSSGNNKTIVNDQAHADRKIFISNHTNSQLIVIIFLVLLSEIY